MVVCAEEDESSLDMDSFMQKDASSGGVRESGDRSEKTCRRLREAIPQAYRTGQCYPDFWTACQAVLPEKQHTAVGKEPGETAHVECWNNTLRQRLARFVRKTLSFSQSLFMHDACLNLFLHRYNLERAAILM
ncbi:MAG: IS1 family transposase [Chloroflexi bacterium]|nr:MAG: IS1 family transposase [Chloroflexota bacterium]